MGENSECAYKIALFGVISMGTTKSEFRMEKCYKISLMIKCELLHFVKRNAERGPPEYKDNTGCPFLAAVTPAAKATVHKPVAHHLIPPEVSASSYLLISEPYLALLN